jgi:hypothetical protein
MTYRCRAGWSALYLDCCDAAVNIRPDDRAIDVSGPDAVGVLGGEEAARIRKSSITSWDGRI